jgi:hypothetical protein
MFTFIEHQSSSSFTESAPNGGRWWTFRHLDSLPPDIMPNRLGVIRLIGLDGA